MSGVPGLIEDRGLAGREYDRLGSPRPCAVQVFRSLSAANIVCNVLTLLIGAIINICCVIIHLHN